MCLVGAVRRQDRQVGVAARQKGLGQRPSILGGQIEFGFQMFQNDIALGLGAVDRDLLIKQDQLCLAKVGQPAGPGLLT